MLLMEVRLSEPVSRRDLEDNKKLERNLGVDVSRARGPCPGRYKSNQTVNSPNVSLSVGMLTAYCDNLACAPGIRQARGRMSEGWRLIMV